MSVRRLGSGLAGTPGDPIAMAPGTFVTGIDASLTRSTTTTTTVLPDTTMPIATTAPSVEELPGDVASSLPATGSGVDEGDLAVVALAIVILGGSCDRGGPPSDDSLPLMSSRPRLRSPVRRSTVLNPR